ncbi:hypothetical protein [Micromonospora sp. KLBMP9576]|uniref:hypothetical protein n=1 Tax=Micromonospora sp. KLBMP9576 TaxID=3424769 RepID=UPI003D8FD520
MANKMLGKVVAGAALGGASLLVFTPGIAFADGHHEDQGKVYAKPHVVKAGDTVKLLEVCPDRQEHAFVWSKVTGKVKLKPAENRDDWRGGEDGSREHDKGKDHEDKGHENGKDENGKDKGKDENGKDGKGKDENGKGENGKGENGKDGKDDNGKPKPPAGPGQPQPPANGGQPPANGGQPPANGQGGGAADAAGHEGDHDWKGYEHDQDAEGDRGDKGHEYDREGHDWSGSDENGWSGEGSEGNGRDHEKSWSGEKSEGDRGYGSDEGDRKDHEKNGSGEESEGNGKDGWEHKRDFVYYGEAEVSEHAKPGRYELKGSCGEGELVVLPRGGVDGGDGGVAGTDRGLAAGGASLIGAAALGGLVLMRRRRTDESVA